jgi:molecular chaperone GrpE
MTTEPTQHDDQKGDAPQPSGNGKLAANGDDDARAGGEAGTGESLGQDEQLARAAAEALEFKDRYMRTAADLENLRRRFDREKSDLLKFGQESLFKDCLPALDSLERALPAEGQRPAGVDEQAQSYLDGMNLVRRQLLEVFRKHGLEPIDARGAPFDPNLHQAIQRIDSDEVDVETVKDEFARGYLLNGRLLRPAMVSVLTPVSG